MSLNLVQFLANQGKLSGGNQNLEKYSSESSDGVPETLDASRPLGELSHRLGDPVKAKKLTDEITGKPSRVNVSEEQKPSSTESMREVVQSPVSKPVQSFDKPAPKKPKMLGFTRVPHNVTEKIAELNEKYTESSYNSLKDDYLAVCCEHCVSGERPIRAIKRASSLFNGDSGWQFSCGNTDHAPDGRVVVEIGEVLEKNSMIKDYIHSSAGSIYVLEELREKIASDISLTTKLAFQRNSGVVFNGEHFSNKEDVVLLNKLGFEIDYLEYSSLNRDSEAMDVYSYIEKCAGVSKDVSRCVDEGKAFSAEHLKEMDYSVPKGYEVKGDLVCPVEKTRKEEKESSEKTAVADHPLESSNIKAVGYSKKEKTLDVAFHSGGEYTYKDVPKNLFDRIKKVKSPGRFFHKHIKNKEYPYTKQEKE